ncbi:MAG: AraC family transcriptional regulator [Niabella sp.]|nr:AraC family transcriptional regulator [Niabella sp.]
MICSINPCSEILKKYIESFSVSVKTGSYPLRYIAYPQQGTCLGLFNQTDVLIKKDYISFTQNPCSAPVAVLLGKITAPTFVTFNDYIEEISINFSPAGINYFFDIPYLKLAPLPHQVLNIAPWPTFLKDLFKMPAENRVSALEKFLLSIIDTRNKHPLAYIEAALKETPAIKVRTLSQNLFMSERNFLRFFKNHFGCPPSTFLRISRFRNMVNAENFSDPAIPLKDIYLANFYYDYSHLKKDFLDLTRQQPSAFLSTISYLGNKKHLFRLI